SPAVIAFCPHLLPPTPLPPLFPYTTLFRSTVPAVTAVFDAGHGEPGRDPAQAVAGRDDLPLFDQLRFVGVQPHESLEPFDEPALDRKSTRLNSSHLGISYAVFCLKKNNTHT